MSNLTALHRGGVERRASAAAPRFPHFPKLIPFSSGATPVLLRPHTAYTFFPSDLLHAPQVKTAFFSMQSRLVILLSMSVHPNDVLVAANSLLMLF
jgi:hypothetical protein